MTGNSYQDDLLRTYRCVRLAMVLLVVMIGTGVGIEVARDGWLPSISDSYYTPARAVFVGCLCAVGTCLIVYRGNTDVEDAVLNGSGFLAWVVAFVPTRPEQLCTPTSVSAEVVASVSNNVPALLVVGLAAFAVKGLVVLVGPPEERRHTRGGAVAVSGTALAFTLLGGYYALAPSSFRCHGHNLAAILLFVGIVVVVGLNGRGLARKQAWIAGDRPWDHRWNRYALGFVLMLVSIAVVAVGGAWQGWIPNWVFWLEAALIGQFALFWVTQTAELWREPKRRQPDEPLPVDVEPVSPAPARELETV